MILTFSMTDLRFDLDFKPLYPTPEIFPIFAWHGWALNHFHKPTGNKVAVQDVSHKDLSEILKQIYPTLTFMELTRFYSCAQQAKITASWNLIFRAYSYHWNDRMLKTVDLARALPENFQQWLQAHDASPRDIAPLLSLKANHNLEHVLTTMVNLNVSRSLGLQILELAVDLQLLGTEIKNILPVASESADSWVSRLKKLRFPMTETLDAQTEQILQSLPWTKAFSKRWTRMGDRSGLEIKFLALSQEDLRNKVKSLQEILSQDSQS